jgi:hypothetical protein
MPKSLVEKLAEVGLAVGELKKLGDNGDYTYLRASDILKAVREKLFNLGVVIIPEDVQVERYQPYKTITDDITDEVRVSVRYRVTDGSESIVGAGCGIGQDYHGKSVYKAQTGALKYFIKTLGLIAGVEDDPETTNAAQVPEALAEKLRDLEVKFGSDVREYPIDQRDVRAFNAACKNRGASPKEIKKFLSDIFQVSNPSALKRKDSTRAIVWATGDITRAAPQETNQENLDSPEGKEETGVVEIGPRY